MKLVILIGPPAVGKMTVGQELEKVSGYKLFHNHMTIEMVAPFFSYGTPQGRNLVQSLREEFFKSFSESCETGYIFTYVWAFSEAGEREYIEGIAGMFEQKGHDVYWIELEANLNERIKRNRTENRLQHKPSKRDLAWSDSNLLETDKKYRVNSYEGEVAKPNYLRIDNTELSAVKVAQQIWTYVN
jgi:shikimate kinase